VPAGLLLGWLGARMRGRSATSATLALGCLLALAACWTVALLPR